jgi:UDP-N-acetylglucosamine--N-acetylmuramyl-(pentapeptide) pyrophosphoryl-undecaprenol N-acetylglucosamine transferase
MPTALICGGGTGGHVFPGIAVADALRDLADVDVVFVGSPRGLETKHVPAHGYRLELLDVEPMKGGGAKRAMRGALVASKATRDAIALVRKLRPDVVLGVGGYAAGPVCLAAAMMRKPLALLEPNSVMGFTNRALSPFAKRVYVAWEETARRVAARKVRVTGVPLRHGFGARAVISSSGPARVLVLGGSQGAMAMNERVPAAIARVLATASDVVVVHQTGPDREDAVRAAYRAGGVAGATVVPFLDDVASQLAAADVVIARAGAVTCAEIAAVGRASLLLPFPHAADDHQTRNAEALAATGGALVLPEASTDAARLAEVLTSLLTDRARRDAMAAAARRHGQPDAARVVAEDLLDLGGIPKRPASARNSGSNRREANKEVS